MYLSFVKYSSVDTFFSQDKYIRRNSSRKKKHLKARGSDSRIVWVSHCGKVTTFVKNNSRPLDFGVNFPSMWPLKKIDISTLQYFFVVHLLSIAYSSSSSCKPSWKITKNVSFELVLMFLILKDFSPKND